LSFESVLLGTRTDKKVVALSYPCHAYHESKAPTAAFHAVALTLDGTSALRVVSCISIGPSFTTRPKLQQLSRPCVSVHQEPYLLSPPVPFYQTTNISRVRRLSRKFILLLVLEYLRFRDYYPTRRFRDRLTPEFSTRRETRDILATLIVRQLLRLLVSFQLDDFNTL
jgi:hypothetical protein